MAGDRTHTGTKNTATAAGRPLPKQPPRRQAGPPTRTIDLGKLRERLRLAGDECRFYMLDEAIEVPERELVKIVSRHIRLEDLRPEPVTRSSSLLDDVKEFDEAARSGHFYESFNVNSKNYRDKSAGTLAFIAEFTRLLDRSVTASNQRDPVEPRRAMETLLALHRYIDECNDDIVFFADEAGAWQIGVDWRTVLPGWFRCLARTTDPAEYARLVDAAIRDFDRSSRTLHLASARQVATAAQRRALATMGAEHGARA